MKLKENFYLIIPILITILLYAISLTYGFRNFDEDSIIQDFYVKKTFSEYVQKYILIDLNGITNATGFAFSSIKNVHWCPLERPLFYLVNFLFQAKPLLFHILSLALHCFVLYFLCLFVFFLTSNKTIAMFSGIIWAIHPVNVEPVIWATNWPALVGALLYFFTLCKVSKKINRHFTEGTPLRSNFAFLFTITLIQILIVEHCISIPVLIFLVTFFQVKHFLNNQNKINPIKEAILNSFPSIVVVIIYLLIRLLFIEASHNAGNNIFSSIERVFFVTPQAFIHHLNMVVLPINLTIDELDLLKLDNKILGSYHIFSLLITFLYLCIAFISHKKLPYLSFGLFGYLTGIAPFLQIIPLYSVVAERYNYFGLAFLVFSFVFILQKILKKRVLAIAILIVLCMLLFVRSNFRIAQWQNSKTLFLSTIKTSKSLFKKGIWTFNLALSESNQEKRKELLKLAANILKIYVDHAESYKSPKSLEAYEIDYNSFIAKAYLRLGKIYEILQEKEQELHYLNKALEYAKEKSNTRSIIYGTLATLFFNSHDFSQAIEYYKKSNEISPNPTSLFAISICYLKLNDLENYEKFLEKAVSYGKDYNSKAMPFTPYAQFLELVKKDFNSAVKYYKMATILENKVEPYILLSTLYLKLNQTDYAFRIIKKGLYGFSTNPTLLYLKGTILINKGKQKEGIAILENVVDKKETTNEVKIEACKILRDLFIRKNDLVKIAKYNNLLLQIDSSNKTFNK